MKRLFSILLAFAMLFSIAGCKGSDKEAEVEEDREIGL